MQYNGKFRQNETLPIHATRCSLRLQVEMNPAHLGDAINDLHPKDMELALRVAIDTCEYKAEEKINVLKAIGAACAREIKETQDAMMFNKKNRETSLLTPATKNKFGV